MGNGIHKILCSGAGKKIANKFLTELNTKEDGNVMQEMSADELLPQDNSDNEVYEWINSSEFINLDVSSCMNADDLLDFVGANIIDKWGQTAYDNIQCSVQQFERVESTEDNPGHVIANMEFNSKINNNSATVDFETRIYHPQFLENFLSQAATDINGRLTSIDYDTPKSEIESICQQYKETIGSTHEIGVQKDFIYEVTITVIDPPSYDRTCRNRIKIELSMRGNSDTPKYVQKDVFSGVLDATVMLTEVMNDIETQVRNDAMNCMDDGSGTCQYTQDMFDSTIDESLTRAKTTYNLRYSISKTPTSSSSGSGSGSSGGSNETTNTNKLTSTPATATASGSFSVEVYIEYRPNTGGTKYVTRTIAGEVVYNPPVAS